MNANCRARTYSYRGIAKWSAELDEEPPEPTLITVDLELTLPSAFPYYQPDQITATLTKDGSTVTDVLIETDIHSLVFANVQGDFVVTLDPTQQFDPSSPDTLTAIVENTLLDIDWLDVVVDESGDDSMFFTGTRERLYDLYEAVDFSGYQFSAGDSAGVSESKRGEFHPYMIQLLGPDGMDQFVDHIETDDGPRDVVKAFDDKYYVAMKDGGSGGGDQPKPTAVLVAKTLTNVVDAGVIRPHQIPGYLGGVLDGFFVHGLWGTVEGAYGLLKFAASAVKYGTTHYSPLGMAYQMTMGDKYEAERQFAIKAWNVTEETVTTMGRIALKVVNLHDQTIEAIITGDLDELRDLGAFAQVTMQMSLEVLYELSLHLQGLTPWEKGEVVGQVLYEVGEFVVTAGTAKVTKLGVLTKLKTAAQSGEFTGGAASIMSAVFQQGSKMVKYMDMLSNTTNKMCFVAGTQVFTAQG